MTIIWFSNTKNERKYLLEYGSDLFGNLFIQVRYGIKLGIAKTYLFDTREAQQFKIDEIIEKRVKNGYELVTC